MAELRAPEQNRLLGQLARMLRTTEGDIAAPEFLPRGLDVMGLVRQLMLPSAETVEKLSYGDPLFRMPTQSNIPITADREYLADIAGMIPFGAPAARPSARAMQDLVRQIQTEPPTGAVTMATKPIGQGLLSIKQDAKKLSEKEFLDKYVTETLPEHLESNNFPEGVRQGRPHEFLPPEMLDPSEWDDWSDRSMSGAAEKIAQFRQSLREGAEFPPVLIHSQKGAFPYVEDGHHRMAAYLDEGFKSVPVSFDMSSLIKIWKEENQSTKKVSDIYKEYTQGLLSSQPKGTPISSAFGTEDPYIYHLSDNKNIESFVSHGIKASKEGMSGPGVYLARTPEETQYYSTLDEGTLYRVDKDKLIKDYGLFHYKENPEGKVQFDETTGEILLDAKNIPPDYVEVKIGNRWMPLQEPTPQTVNIDTAKLPASSDDIVGNPKINEDFVDLYHVTDEDSLAKIESSGVLDNTMATSNFQGYAPAIQGTYGWSSPERARFEVDRLADTIGSTEGLVILKVRVPRSEFNRLKPDEDSGIDDWRQSYLEGGSAAIEGPIPLSFVKQIYKGE